MLGLGTDHIGCWTWHSCREWKDSVRLILHLLCILRRNWGTKKYLGRENHLISCASKETCKRSMAQWLYHYYLAQVTCTSLWSSKQQRCLSCTLDSVVKGISSQFLPCYDVNSISVSSHFQFHLSPEPFICD